MDINIRRKFQSFIVACLLVPSSLLSAQKPAVVRPDTGLASFSWWVGTWGYSVPGYDPAVSTITASGRGDTLEEAFVDRGGQKQHTTLTYDATDGSWRRVVVDPFRTYRSVGRFAPDGTISFYETPTDRESYRPTDHDHVHFVGEKSSDGGKTWQVLFDATYTRQ